MLQALRILDLHGSVHDVLTSERRSAAVDAMLARCLPALPALSELSLHALQLSTADAAGAVRGLSQLTGLSLCDLVFQDAAAARRFGAAVLALPALRRLRTDWVELIEPPFASHGHVDGDFGDAGPGGRSRLLSITGWLLTGECLRCGAPGRLRQTLRVLEVEDYHGLDWGVLGARVACLSQLQALEVDGLTFERKPSHAEALLRQLAAMANLEEVRLLTNFEAVACSFDEKDQWRLKRLVPGALVSFIGHRMCGPNVVPIC